MLITAKLKFMLLLQLIVLSCLNSCTTVSCNFSCPVYPVAGASVAAELENVPPEKLVHTWEWLGRINRLRQELDVCAEND